MAAEQPVQGTVFADSDSDDDVAFAAAAVGAGVEEGGFTDEDSDGGGGDDVLGVEEEAVLAAARRKRRRSKTKRGKAPPKKKKSRRSLVSQFVEGEAVEDEDEVDEDYARGRRVSTDEGAAAEAAAAKIRAEYEGRRKDALGQKSVQEIAEYYEQRERETGYADRGRDFDLGDTGGLAAQQAELPSVDDPKLWMVKVKPGEEMEILLSVLNKYAFKYNEGHPLKIFSAVSSSKEYIYVEAYREDAVKEALTGIGNVYAWRPGSIKMLPLPQMTTALTVTAQLKSFAQGQWVRINRGAYKGDLAQVVDVLDGGAKVLLRAIPRLDLALLAMAEAQRKAAKATGRMRRRPPQKKFSVDEVTAALGGDMTAVEDGVLHKETGAVGTKFRGNFYSGGFLLKEWRVAFVETNGEPPTLEELQAFKPPGGGGGAGDGGAGEWGESLVAELTAAAKRQGGARSVLVPGDKVYLREGELEGLEGRVVSVQSDGSAFTMALAKELQEELGFAGHIQVPRGEAIKVFDIGDHVKVVAGMHAGATGTVIHTTPGDEGNGGRHTAVVMLDATPEQVQVWFQDLRETSEVVADASSLEGYKKYDLVDVQTAAGYIPQTGIVTGLGHRTLHLLLSTGEATALPVFKARGNISAKSARAVAMDSAGETLNVGDSVRVLQGTYKGLQGTLKHISGTVLFMHSTAHPRNAGCFVAKRKQVLLAGQKAGGAKASFGTLAAGAAAAGGGAAVAGARSRKSRDLVDEEFKGKTVKVLRGSKRGQIGMVKLTVGDTVKVFLQAELKLFVTTRNNVEVVGDRHGAFASRGVAAMGGGATAALFAGGATPAGGGMTPAVFGGATPALGGATPAGGVTPAMGGVTPGFGGATPAYGGATPAYGGATPRTGSTTPAGGATPALSAGARTPGGGTTPGAVRASFGSGLETSSLPLHCKAGVVVTLNTGVHAGQQGVLQRVDGEGVVVEVTGGDGVAIAVVVPGSDTTPVRPVAGDKVQVLSGAGGTGTVAVVDGSDNTAVVTMDAGQVANVPLADLAKANM